MVPYHMQTPQSKGKGNWRVWTCGWCDTQGRNSCSIPPPPPPPPPCLPQISPSRIEALCKSVEALDISEEQRHTMRTFLKEKIEILKHGEMKDNQFETLTELGVGNGGVVLKVKHKPSGAIMARKVQC